MIHFLDRVFEEAETISPVLHPVQTGHVKTFPDEESVTSSNQRVGGYCRTCPQDAGQKAGRPDEHPAWTSSERAHCLIRLVTFLQKYECQPWLNIALRDIQLLYRENSTVKFFEFFAACAVVGNVEYCEQAIQLEVDRTENTDMVNPRKWPTTTWSLIPQAYISALSAASEGTLAPQDEYEAWLTPGGLVADEFAFQLRRSLSKWHPTRDR